MKVSPNLLNSLGGPLRKIMDVTYYDLWDTLCSDVGTNEETETEILDEISGEVEFSVDLKLHSRLDDLFDEIQTILLRKIERDIKR